MKGFDPLKSFLWALALTTVLVVVLEIHQAEPASSGRRCTVRGHVSRSTIVWASPPKFYSKRGWSAPQLVRLPNGSTAYSCRTLSIGYFGNRLLVRQIAFRVGNRWLYGWIPADLFRPQRESSLSVRLAALTAQNVPPPIPDKGQVEKGVSGGLYGLYGQLFFAVLMGILARGVWDWTAAPHEIQSHIRSAVGAAVLTPIVFGSFLQTADFSIEGEKGYVMLLLLSFQQGFFWQGLIRDVGQKRNT